MKKIITLVVVVLLISAVFTGCQIMGEKEPVVYTLAALPNDAGEMTEYLYFVMKEMNIALEPFNVTVEYTVADDYSVVAESILSGTAHIGTPSGATYAKARIENNNIYPMFIRAPKGVASGYYSLIVTHIDNKSDFEGMSEEEALKSLKGKSFGFVAATSTSGRLVPTTTFWNLFGPDGTNEISSRSQVFELTTEDGGVFSEIQFGGCHSGSVNLVVNKKVYAGATWDSVDRDKDLPHLEPHRDNLYVIATVLVPNGPFWINKEFMKQEHIDAIVEHFVNLTPENASEGMFTENPVGESLHIEDRFLAVEPEFYEFLEVMFEEEK
ncbi:MAG: PhnD/SsuA/transferrin family substrate-binding protein [Clostridiales bacterium]|nr:PhnD/SsuA/transferrin family substrate-binding protein [Clostridiales bacterium]